MIVGTFKTTTVRTTYHDRGLHPLVEVCNYLAPPPLVRENHVAYHNIGDGNRSTVRQHRCVTHNAAQPVGVRHVLSEVGVEVAGAIELGTHAHEVGADGLRDLGVVEEPLSHLARFSQVFPH